MKNVWNEKTYIWADSFEKVHAAAQSCRRIRCLHTIVLLLLLIPPLLLALLLLLLRPTTATTTTTAHCVINKKTVLMYEAMNASATEKMLPMS